MALTLGMDRREGRRGRDSEHSGMTEAHKPTKVSWISSNEYCGQFT